MYNLKEPRGASNCRLKYAEKVDDEAAAEVESDRDSRGVEGNLPWRARTAAAEPDSRSRRRRGTARRGGGTVAPEVGVARRRARVSIQLGTTTLASSGGRASH